MHTVTGNNCPIKMACRTSITQARPLPRLLTPQAVSATDINGRHVITDSENTAETPVVSDARAALPCLSAPEPLWSSAVNPLSHTAGVNYR